MAKLSEEDMWSQDRPKAKAFVPLSQLEKVKEKFLKEIKCPTLVNTWMIIMQNNFDVHKEKVLVVWVAKQTSHSIL